MRASTVIDGKKFMWDGAEYGDESGALDASERYASQGFETRVIREGGKPFVFTRRVVTEITLEGAPPA